MTDETGLIARMASSMYPACEMLEYASMRFTFCWYTAVILESKSVAAAIPHNTLFQASFTAEKQVANNWKNAAKAAVFTMVDMYAVTGVGAAWYTSGDQKWKGTAET